MANDESKEREKPESKFAEVIRKGKEKRAGMDQQSSRREEPFEPRPTTDSKDFLEN